ncbi:hypothetical protein SDC9_120087 [bioreactor metagenome]|uniref:Uncharacterized protein n=1 Tax=bioreactor metagenome TaxID=1076179 RepID=A0A645C7S0_9ZZZZ
MRKHLRGCAVHGDFAFRKYDDAVCKRGLFHKMRDHNNRYALFVEPAHRIKHLAPTGRVEHGRRFVEHKHLRLHGQ